jgi:hypothetical protein
VLVDSFTTHLSNVFLLYTQYVTTHLPSSSALAGTTLAFFDIAQKDIGACIAGMVQHLIAHTKELKVFEALKAQLAENRERTDHRLKTADWLGPHSRLTPIQMVDAFFGGTPMRQLFDVEIAGPEPTVPEIEERHWYQHSLLIAPTQTGKTNVIQWRMAQLLPLVAQGKASIVLMEPKGVLTTDILNMAQTWNMRDRVVILDPADTPVSVNIFDKGDGSSQATTETVGRIARVIGTLSSEFTGFQRDAITFAVRAMFALPEPASMRMLMRILRGGKAALPLESLPETVRDYFELDYREADGRFIVSRLSSLLGNTVFETLFTGKRTTFDMLKEIQAGKLIVVNCASRALGGDSTLYARFWIEEVQRCVYPRLAMPPERRTPTTFIIDEAQDYIAEDRHVAALLAQAAEARIGMMFGMHYLGQLTDAFVRDAVANNTNLKFAARPATDVPTLARAMNTESEFLTSLPLFTFAYRGPGLQTAIRVKFPEVEFGKMPQMTAEQYAELRQANSRKYAYGEPSPPPPPPEEPPATRENVSMDDLSLADAYAQLAVAIRRGDAKRTSELQEWIRDHTPESPPGRNPGEASKDGW